jgi:MOSC domain-containing protein YiiM
MERKVGTKRSDGLKNHGGPSKAIYAYDAEDLAYFRVIP